eukprot:6412527-Amphidinium_carterae.2
MSLWIWEDSWKCALNGLVSVFKVGEVWDLLDPGNGELHVTDFADGLRAMQGDEHSKQCCLPRSPTSWNQVVLFEVESQASMVISLIVELPREVNSGWGCPRASGGQRSSDASGHAHAPTSLGTRHEVKASSANAELHILVRWVTVGALEHPYLAEPSQTAHDINNCQGCFFRGNR